MATDAATVATPPTDSAYPEISKGAVGRSVPEVAPGVGTRYQSVNSLFIRPSSSGTLYAVIDDERVFTSIDGGASWAPAAFPAEILVSDPQTPGTVYAGTAYGIFKSTDAGDSWNPASSGLPASPSGSALNISALALDPDGTGTLYAGSGMIGVFKSADGGASWNAASSEILASFVSSLAIDPEDSATIYAAAGLVFKSGDGGAHWGALNFGPPCCVSTLAIDAQDPNTIYAAVENGGVWKSTDGGVSWANLAEFNAVGIAIDPQNTGTVYVGVQGAGTGSGGIWKSTDGGTNWTKSVVPAGGGVHGFRIDSRAPAIWSLGMRRDCTRVRMEGRNGAYCTPRLSGFFLIWKSIPGTQQLCTPSRSTGFSKVRMADRIGLP